MTVVRNVSLAIVAGLIVLGSARADVLMLRDGSRRSGRLQSCFDESCNLSGKRIPIETIARIVFERPGLPSASTDKSKAQATDVVVLRDGKVHRGKFSSVDLGEVSLEEGTFDRDDVASIDFADTEGDIGLAPVTRDYVLGRGGSVAEGVLQACTGGSCRIGTSTVSDSAFIGLQREASTPPQVQDSARGEIHLTSGEVKPAKLLGISSAKVVTDRGEFPRSAVAWIYVAPPSQSGPAEPPYYGAPRSPAPPQPPSEPPPPPPPSPPPPRPPPPPPSSGTGALWTGTIRGRYWGTFDDESGGVKRELLVTVDVKLRETAPIPLAAPGTRTVIGRRVNLDPAGSTITNKFSWTSSSPSLSQSCSGIGTTTHPGATAARHDGLLMTKTRNGDTRQLAGIDIPLGQTLYGVAYLVSAVSADQFTVECRVWGTGMPEVRSTFKSGYIVPPLGHVGVVAPRENGDSEFRFLQGTGTMVGSYQAPSLIAYQQMSAEWSICRAGTRCPPLPGGDGPVPPAPPTEPDEDDCNNASPHRAQMDLLWTRRKLMAERLKTDWNAFDAAYREHIDNVEGWRSAIDLCMGIDIAFEVVERLAGSFGDAADLIGKVANADPTYLVPIVDGAVWDDVLRGFGELMQQAFPGEASSQLSMYRAKLNSCSSSLPADVLASARAYLDSAAVAKRLQPLVQRLRNDIRNTDQEYWDEWHKNYRDCLQCAREKGLDAAICIAPPPQPAGPMPGEGD